MATKHLLASGHTACAGCGQAAGARLVVDAAGPNTILTNSTGCLEVFTNIYPRTAWGVPWIHSLFENAASVASGVEAALTYLGKLDDVRVIAQAGDGSTADIGFQAISGMFERGQDVLYVCYDNGAYMNTGIQRSSQTPFDANTTTTPPGKKSFGKKMPQKNLPLIFAAHGIPYSATASVAFPTDVQRKVKRALDIRGPKYLQIFVPCPLGWHHDPGLTYDIARLAVETGLFPVIEYRDGELASVRKIRDPKPVEEYLKLQGRFRHLFSSPAGEAEIQKIQEIADNNIRKLGLVSERPRKEAEPEEKKEEKVSEPKKFTLEELAKCDGKEGRPAYIAYKGKVYDVSAKDLWDGGEHMGLHEAGNDMTAELEDATHGEENLEDLPVVGELEG
ncbi:thiamine pyrophosphate-dependent enzyme [Candidatus Poribacteria bacterium]